ncbi:hypothetical protein BOX15_Mlig003461g1 [Macrostomum lignano]|uniref:MFS domain-containing protein n=1 Tax=Macrostomum lignano TaxID=282301 RepID=A0A267DXI5_9PLAT|nr:hypothetical protein BOX15_Mlig003461g1 [Macrostomum lignano]
MSLFIFSFYFLCLVCFGLYIFTRKTNTPPEGSNDAEFVSFRNSYLIVYTLGMAGDWLQGPYVYALYEHYGMSKRDIEFLFVAGFGASMLFGTIVGSIADKYGRRKNCIIYGIVYGLTCITKHFNNFWVLLIGRLLGGTATSILWSGFESWLVHEHHSRGYSEHQLEETFNLAIFFNSIGAIASGLVSQYAVDWFGFVAPSTAPCWCCWPWLPSPGCAGQRIMATPVLNSGPTSLLHGMRCALTAKCSAWASLRPCSRAACTALCWSGPRP